MAAAHVWLCRSGCHYCAWRSWCQWWCTQVFCDEKRVRRQRL